MVLAERARKRALLTGIFALGCFACKPSEELSMQKEWVIAVIPKGEQHVFWSNVREGAERQGKAMTKGDSTVIICWRPPIVDDDVDRQVNEVRTLSSSRNGENMVDGIVLAPLHAERLYIPVWRAHNKSDIPVVIMDSELAGVADQGHEPKLDFLASVRTNNYEAGRRAAALIKEYLKQTDLQVSFWIFPYSRGSGSTERREHGFKRRVAELFPEAELDFMPHGGATADDAEEIAESFLRCAMEESEDCSVAERKCCKMRQQRKKGEKIAFFAPNESTSEGLLAAAKKVFWDQGIVLRQQSNRELRLRALAVGFDFSEKLKRDLVSKNPFYFAVIRQDPVEIGRRSVEVLANKLQGQVFEFEEFVDVVAISRENADERAQIDYLYVDNNSAKQASQHEKCSEL